MNLFSRIAEILDKGWGDDHLEYIEKLLKELDTFLTSDYFEKESMCDDSIDELIEYLQTKKSKPKDTTNAQK
jgi:hypothetical protein